MEIAYTFKNFLVCTFKIIIQIWSTSDPPPSTPPSSPPSPALDHEAQAATWAHFAHADHHDLQWPKIVLSFCFTSVLEIALLSVQTQSLQQLPLTFHFMSLAISFAFASLFVAEFIGSKFPAPAHVLEQLSVFFAATAFFLAVTIPFPRILKCITWALYAVCLLAIFVCNLF